MKAVKLVFALLVIVFLTIVVWQNQGVFMDKKVLGIDLVAWNYTTQPIHLSLYFLSFFLIGLLVAYFHGLCERFRAKRTIANQLQTIRNSEKEIEALKNVVPAEQANPQNEEVSSSPNIP